MDLKSFTLLNSLIGGEVLWANLRRAGRAYEYRGEASHNGLLLVEAGRARATVNGRSAELLPGAVIALSCGDALNLSALGRRNFSFFVFNFTLFDNRGREVSMRELDFPIFFVLKGGGVVRSECGRLLALFRGRGPFREIRLSSAMATLVSRLHGLVRPAKGLLGAGQGAQAERLRRAVAHVYANLHRKLTLSEIARAACLNQSYFSRLFRKRCGETPMGFVSRLKIERAKGVLLNSDLSVGRVAESFGFESQAHFSRKFKAVTGRTPSSITRK